MTNKILATVGDSLTVTEKELNDALVTLSQRGQDYNNPQGRAAVLEQLVSNKLFLLDAQKNLYEYNPEFKAELQKIKEDMLINFALSKSLETVKPATDDEVKEYFEKNKAMFVKPETVSASHILVDTEEKANEILAEIKDGKVSFEDAARNNSSCPSAENGGALGEFSKGQMVPEFDEAVFSMNVGDISAPVKTQFGYHIIKLTAKSEAGEYSFDDIKEQLKTPANKEKQQAAIRSKINQLKILYPVQMH